MSSIKPIAFLFLLLASVANAENFKAIPYAEGTSDCGQIHGIYGPKTFTHGYLDLTSQSYLVFQNITFSQCGQIRGSLGAHHITFINCKFEKLDPANIIYCELGPHNDYWTFDRCEFSECPNAIYGRIGGGPPANGLRVTNCYFHDIATGTYAVQKDGHCIGIQGGTGHQIAWNKIRNVGGTAICAWAPMDKPMTYINLYENDIDGVKKNPGASGSGIEISSSYDLTKGLPKAGSRFGHLLIRNRISNCEGNGFRYACAVDPLYDNEGNVYANCAAGNEYIFNPFAAKGNRP